MCLLCYTSFIKSLHVEQYFKQNTFLGLAINYCSSSSIITYGLYNRQRVCRIRVAHRYTDNPYMGGIWHKYVWCSASPAASIPAGRLSGKWCRHVRRRHHLGRADREVGLEVVRQPRAEALGLADVDHPAVGVFELVGAGRVGDRAGGRTLDHAS